MAILYTVTNVVYREQYSHIAIQTDDFVGYNRLQKKGQSAKIKYQKQIHNSKEITGVIPAEAGIHSFLDPRFHGDDKKN